PATSALSPYTTLFRSFYVAAPTCSPSRAGLLTGLIPQRVGVTRVLFPLETIGLAPQQVTIAEVLRDTGYATACIGKWHLGRPMQDRKSTRLNSSHVKI